MTVKVVLDHGAINRLLRSPAGPVASEMLKRGHRVEHAAKRLCPVDKGRLRSSIGTKLIIADGAPGARIGTRVRYALWVHEGTGVYGPRHSFIRPVTAKVLVFRPKGAARGRKGRVYAMKVRGSPPRPFLVLALSAAY